MVQSVREQMDVLKQLVGADEEIRKLDVELGKEREAIDGAKRELDRVRGLIEQERTQYATIEADRNSRVQEARVMTQQLERSREKLSRVRKEAEANAVQREIEETRKILRDLEDGLGKRVLELEALKKNVLDHEDEEARYVAQIGQTEGAVSAKVAEISGQRAIKWSARDGVAKALPSSLLKKYDAIRGKRGSGAAQMLSGRCQACNIGVPSQLAQRIQRIDVLEQCPSCNRYLFVEPATPSTPVPSPGA